MESEVKKQRNHQRNRRRERAQRMQAQRESKAASGQKDIAGDSGEDESPVREKPPRPPNRRKKLKEPIYEEDIIDGFAILAFKSYEDLENAVKKHSEKHHAARHNNNHVNHQALQPVGVNSPSGVTIPRVPKPIKHPLLNSSGGGDGKGLPGSAPSGPTPPRLHHHHMHILHNHHVSSNGLHASPQPSNGTSLQGYHPNLLHDGMGGSSMGGAPQALGSEQRLNGPSGGLMTPLRDGSRDDRLSDASSQSSSGRGYICDSESDDDKASDAGSDLFTASRKRELPASPRRSSGAQISTSSSPSSALPGILQPPAPPPPPSLPGVISLRVPHRPSRRPLAGQQPASSRASPDSPPPRLLSSASPPLSAAAAAAAGDSVASSNAVAPSSVPPPYPPLYAPYSSATVPGTAPSPYLAPSSPGANAAIHRNERISKSPCSVSAGKGPPGVPPPHMSPLQGLGGPQPPHPIHPPPQPGIWAPAVAASSAPSSVPGASVNSSAGLGAPNCTTATSHRDVVSSSISGRPHSPRGHSPTRERDSYSSNVSSLSRGSSTTPATCPAPSSPFGAPPSCVPGGSPAINVASTASPGGLLSFSSKSPVVTASVGAPNSWPGISLNPPAPVSSAPVQTSSGPSPSVSTAPVHSGPFAPPSSTSSHFPPPLPVSSSSSSAPPSSTTSTSSASMAPPNPNPFSAESLFGSSQAADMLRRELDNRFLASSQDRGSLGPPPFLRAEMHHHQHQHTHVHQHTTPMLPPGCSALLPPPTLFKDIPKLAGVESPYYRQPGLSLSAGYPAFTQGLLHHGLSSSTPFNPPAHLTPFAPKMGDPSKPKPVKTGRWNAMHVRIAWEIHYHQQSKAVEAKAAAAAAVAAGKVPSSELLRPPSGPHHLFGGLPPPPNPSQSSTAFSAMPPGHAPPPPHHHRGPPYVEPPPPAPHPSFLASHLPPFGRFPGFAPPGASPFAGLSSLGNPGVFQGRDLGQLGQLPSPHEQWSRLHRTPPGFPPTPHGSPWSLGKSELERREMEERERLRRERERAELERERAERELREKERAAAQAAAELAKRKSQQEAAERERREREREIEKREQREREKQMRERQHQHLLQQQQHHHSSHHHRSSSATPPDRKPPLNLPSSRDRSPHRISCPPTENGEVKVKEERREDDKNAAAAAAAATAAMMERDRYMYMARQAQANSLNRAVGMSSPAGGPPGLPHPGHPSFAATWDPYSHHRFDPMAMRFNPLSAAAHAAAAAAMYREREEAMVAPPPPHALFSPHPPLMGGGPDRASSKGVPPPPSVSHKLATSPPHPLYSPLGPPNLLGGSSSGGPGKLLSAPQQPTPPSHKLSTPPSRLDIDLHKKEESQSR